MQKSYSYKTPVGVAGGLSDLAPFAIESRINGETVDGKLKFGMGAVQGNKPGSNVVVPVAGTAADKYEGIVMTGFSQEMNMSGEVAVKAHQTVGILRYGNAWVRTVPDITPAYGESLHLIISGDNAGLFTNASSSNTIVIAGRFVGGLGTGDVAPAELFNQKQS